MLRTFDKEERYKKFIAKMPEHVLEDRKATQQVIEGIVAFFKAKNSKVTFEDVEVQLGFAENSKEAFKRRIFRYALAPFEARHVRHTDKEAIYNRIIAAENVELSNYLLKHHPEAFSLFKMNRTHDLWCLQGTAKRSEPHGPSKTTLSKKAKVESKENEQSEPQTTATEAINKPTHLDTSFSLLKKFSQFKDSRLSLENIPSPESLIIKETKKHGGK